MSRKTARVPLLVAVTSAITAPAADKPAGTAAPPAKFSHLSFVTGKSSCTEPVLTTPIRQEHPRKTPSTDLSRSARTAPGVIAMPSIDVSKGGIP